MSVKIKQQYFFIPPKKSIAVSKSRRLDEPDRIFSAQIRQKFPFPVVMTKLVKTFQSLKFFVWDTGRESEFVSRQKKKDKQILFAYPENLIKESFG